MTTTIGMTMTTTTMCATHGLWYDGEEWLARCDQCGDHHYFRAEHFAKTWANHHAYGMRSETRCTCCARPSRGAFSTTETALESA